MKKYGFADTFNYLASNIILYIILQNFENKH